MKRTEIVKLLREASDVDDMTEDLSSRLKSAANSLVVLKEPLDDFLEAAQTGLEDMRCVKGDKWPRTIRYKKAISSVKEFIG